MVFARGLGCTVLILPIVWGGGCASSGPSAVAFSVQHVSATESPRTFEAAEAVLMNLGYTLERRDPAAGVLITRPIESDYRERYGNQSRRLGTEGRLRRYATIHTSESGDGVNVFCRVTIQEQSTQVYRFLAESGREGDSETSTAIDRDAGTTARQNSVWRNVDRDRAAERAILEAIAEHRQASESPGNEEPPSIEN